MATELPEFTKTAQNEVLINNAYLIPDEDMLANASNLVQRGVKLRIITNSLASQDVPAVNSHYGPLRKSILETGIDLYELRPDAEIKAEVDTRTRGFRICRPAYQSRCRRSIPRIYRVIQSGSAQPKYQHGDGHFD